MSDDLMREVFHYSFVYAIYTCLSVPISTFLLSYAVPKQIVKKYFREPYFNEGDDEMFEHFPFRYYLTIWIAQYTASNWFARRRKLYDLRKDSPTYWRILAWVYFWIILIPFILAVFLSILGMCYFELTDRAVP